MLSLGLLLCAFISAAVCASPPVPVGYQSVDVHDEHVHDVAEWAVDNIQDSTKSKFELTLVSCVGHFNIALN